VLVGGYGLAIIQLLSSTHEVFELYAEHSHSFTGLQQLERSNSMSHEEIVRRIVEEGWNQGHLAVFDELCAPDFAFHDPNFPKVKSLEDLKQHIVGVRSIFPDFHLTMEDLVAVGERVADRWIFTGTYYGGLPMPPPPSQGIYVKVQGFSILRFDRGKMVEQWHQGDQLGLWQQLGGIPKEQASSVAV
jgi:predicted ester cyclase